MRKLFVGNVNWDAGDDDLRNTFEVFGQVESAKVIFDKETGRSRGFGFVEFSNEDAAQDVLNKGEIDILGRTAVVKEAQENNRKQRAW